MNENNERQMAQEIRYLREQLREHAKQFEGRIRLQSAACDAALAAEREKVAQWPQKVIDEAIAAKETVWAARLSKALGELAAEREKVAMNEGIEDELREANQRYYDCEVKLAAAVEALKGMLAVYEELHARYDLGDCQATVDSRAAIAKSEETQEGNPQEYGDSN